LAKPSIGCLRLAYVSGTDRKVVALDRLAEQLLDDGDDIEQRRAGPEGQVDRAWRSDAVEHCPRDDVGNCVDIGEISNLKPITV
jgi:hypothetical protein